MRPEAAAITADPMSVAAPSGWRRWRRWLVPLFAAVVLGLLLFHAGKVDWAGAWAALHRYSPLLLLGVLGLATASHAVYGCFDLIGRQHTHHGLARWRTWAIAVTSFAFNLNLGALVGSVGLRTRLYTRAGLDEATIAQVVALSLATNWLGYALIAGGLFASGTIRPPGEAHLGMSTFRALGVLMVLVALGYVVACALSHGREWRWRGRTLKPPSGRLALLQLALSSCHWLLTGTAMYLLLGRHVPYSTTLAVLMAASIAGVITPIPAGLGVLEAVYLALLSGSVRQSALMGAVLAYRALYYLVPLGGGLLLYMLLERHAATSKPPTG
ncbi:lysylphosphatidylglycerol synthase domain-containing protein [Variovorax sp. Sphag1AA]|uniref:lysylphosphatidylglycerol synthase domain-containing protein n=1 Tax=Variovorax sp. Sphag1AA TaxID=2587027 RepID=UPI00161A5154|nr:lysylphosphatidylglycerol synthase domain-containing protein [Variovorax sp. Sphag1AA]MBB3181312.1 hypothetical protein [Variovorax sp. Sphag1AA]